MVKIPNVVSYDLPDKVDNSFSNELYEEPLQTLFKGRVNKEGEWFPRNEPAAGWKVTKKEIGKYLIEHFMNNINVSINISLINELGNISVINTTYMSFEVEIRDEKRDLADKNFVFSVSFRANS